MTPRLNNEFNNDETPLARVLGSKFAAAASFPVVSVEPTPVPENSM